MMDFPIDTGNKQIKTKNFTFISGMVRMDTAPSMTDPDDCMRYNGKYYVLSNRRDKYQRDKSESDQYFMLTLLGMVRELDLAARQGSLDYEKDRVYHMNVLCGLPPAHMSDASLKRNFKNYFRTPEPVKVWFKGRTWTIKVDKVNVYAQCYAAIMTVFPQIKDYPNVLGIDIGGFTADYILLKKGRIYDIDNTDSMENGVIILYNRVRRECAKKFDALIEESDVDEILAQNTAMYGKEIVDTVNREAERFVMQLLESFREQQIDLKNCYVVFIGGGSMLLRKFIEKSPLLKTYKFLDDLRANVHGYEFLYRISKQKAVV